jgi:prolyl-tRNA synthetase
MSQFFLRTLRNTGEDIESVSHQLSLRAGLIQMVSSGHYNFLPLGLRVLRKVENIVRQEMDAIGSQETIMVQMMQKELLVESGRWDAFGPVLFKLKNRSGHDLCLGPTHEEPVTFMARAFIQSYKDLPVTLYQIANKMRDEPRARGGLLRAREFIMKDAYSFEANEQSLDNTYNAMRQAYFKIFERCGVKTMIIEADTGAMGGKSSNEFMVVSDIGEDNIIICDQCDKAMNQEMAPFDKTHNVYAETTDAAPEKVHTPDTKTIEDLAAFLKIKPEQCLKHVLYKADGALVIAIIRGDLDVNDVKLTNQLKCTNLDLAAAEDLAKAGIAPGFASPIGLSDTIRVILDDSIAMDNAYVCGANEKDYHMKNIVPARDFPKHVETADIAMAGAGHKCAACDAMLRVEKGIELGHIFKLGTRYSVAMNAKFTDEDGKEKPMIMGCYGIGVTRLLSAAIEQHHDEHGIVWPKEITPFDVHMMTLGKQSDEVDAAAEALYQELKAAGFDVLYDDRSESPGVKFNDADLIGLPVRLVVSAKTLKENAVEMKLRSEQDRSMPSRDSIVDIVREALK